MENPTKPRKLNLKRVEPKKEKPELTQKTPDSTGYSLNFKNLNVILIFIIVAVVFFIIGAL